MTLKREHLKEAKSSLKSMSRRTEKRITKADFVAGLIQDIHAKMTAGFSLQEICAELNKTLPSDEQLNMNTFKTYVRRTRSQAGIAPTRPWTRRIPPAKTATKTSSHKGTTKVHKGNPASDFRDQGGEL